MILLYKEYCSKKLLSRDSFFSPLLTEHFEQALGIFYFLYNARDWDTMQTNICWARINLNPGMFVYAITQALQKRGDFYGLILPKIYEIMPQHFLNQETIHRAEKFDYASWSTAEIYKTKRDMKEIRKTNLHYHMSWQWWLKSKIGYDFFDTSDNNALSCKTKTAKNSALFTQAMEDIDYICLSTDYSRNNFFKQTERKLTYLIEDVDWNGYWYYLNMGLSIKEAMTPQNVSNFNEYWLWNLQQLVARYKLEKYAVGLTEVLNDPCSTHKMDYIPNMISKYGEKFEPMSCKLNEKVMQFIRNMQAYIERAISKESYDGRSVKTIDLHKKENVLNMLQEFFNINLKQMYDYWSSSFNIKPNLLLNYETMLRTPLFYYFAEILLSSYRSLITHYQPYDSHLFQLPGVKINNVNISALVTHFDLYNVDISNLLNEKHFYIMNQFQWKKSLQAKQQRLNHKPFTLLFNVTSDKPQAIVLRTFLTSTSRSYRDHSENIYQLDTFVTNVVVGVNIIQRKSIEFFGTTTDPTGYSELYQYTLIALDNKFVFPLNITTPDCAFPNRLILPQGSSDGVKMEMIFVATLFSPNDFRFGNNMNCNFADGILSFDNLPFGFPFDRNLDEFELLNRTNVLRKSRESSINISGYINYARAKDDNFLRRNLFNLKQLRHLEAYGWQPVSHAIVMKS
ncbi:larval serum protein 1 beta chain-like [Teleopsis dalmanni]|uniref:larval serum protein 1 beta chain-like n=1 Tax=Teleopsis dalmanni TaxID=139649 RepID=UPI0018CCD83E|nr:larval serum protein 1 beta chain-like [Teleopsis dalmanni]